MHSARGRQRGDREFAHLPAVEVPGEWFGGLHVIVLKRQHTACDVGEGLKIIGDKDLALHDRKVDLGLVELTSMHWRVHQSRVRVRLPQTLARGLAPVTRTVVDDPEHAVRRGVRFPPHYVVHQPSERKDAGRRFASPEDLLAMHVPRR